MDEDMIGLAPLLLGGSAWALRPDVLPRVAAASRLQVQGTGPGMPEQLASNRARKVTRRGSTARTGGSVVVIPLCGILSPQGSFLSYLFYGGAGGLQGFRDEFAEAVADPDVGAIVLDVDSPGGLVDLTPETAADIREARGSGKPIIAVANTQACSGAYWIASQADELVVTPSGQLGSVGVYMVHEDWSKFEDNLGVDTTFVFAGQYKTEGNASQPLSDDAKAAWQSEVDQLYAMFTGDVAQGRDVAVDVVKADYGEGRVLLAQVAVDAGMADRVATLEEVVAELLDNSSSTAGGSARSALGIRAELVRERLATNADQPQCPGCGKYMPDEDGRETCDDCAEPDEPDEDVDEEEDEGEIVEPGTPEVEAESTEDTPNARADLVDVLL